MPRHFTAKRLLVASHNRGKIREIADLLAPFGIAATGAAEHDLEAPEETGDSFIANAVIKSLTAASATGVPALADDSGLVVPALDGAPGLHSARWAGPDGDFAAAMARLWQQLEEKGAQTDGDRRAHFVCALSLAWPDGHVENFEGRIDGCLVWPPRGDRGFGYDPIFLPHGHRHTFGEMEPAVKHALSHRAVAFGKMIDGCFRS